MRLIENNPRAFKQGKWRPTYSKWVGMRARCSRPSSTSYSHYGGRGIGICERWDKFENFLEDMGEAPSSQHSIDRLDSNKDYSPENCRWGTSYDQARTKKSNVYITINNCKLCLGDWAKWMGIRPSVIRSRKFKYGWSWPDAILTPRKTNTGRKAIRLSDLGVTWDEGTDY